MYDFHNFKTIRSFAREIYSEVYILNNVFEEQINLKQEIDNFHEYTKPKNLSKYEENVPTFGNAKRLLKGRKKILNGFESKLFLKTDIRKMTSFGLSYTNENINS